jgi:hypothetical protein
MSEQEKQENQKTIVAFAAGLLIGGLLVWVFGGAPKADAPQDDVNATTTEEVGEEIEVNDATTTDEDADDEDSATPVMSTGTGAVELNDQEAGTRVSLESATFPSDEGWIGVRDYANGQLAGILGVARFSKEQGLIPKEIILQRATKAGSTYAIVFYSESGDRVFSLADDVQAGGVVKTFTAK